MAGACEGDGEPVGKVSKGLMDEAWNIAHSMAALIPLVVMAVVLAILDNEEGRK